ncbi:MAG: MFS transporter [Ruminococcaceae bacterium]|nr:MFS transporter [Oscillospiraceae bacterium]
MLIKNNYKATIAASFLGYITQAIMLNFPPLLYIFFQNDFGLTLSQVSFLITANIIVELIVDIIVSKFAVRIGYRPLVIAATCFATLGLLSMFLLPSVMANKFVALILAMMLCGAGGGIMEVLISPIVEACPTKNKNGMMSLLHSFYCWGQAAVVLISTVFFQIFGLENWIYIAIAWTAVPLTCMVLFSRAPIYMLQEESEKGTSILTLFKNKIFWVLILMMICAGASELAMAQWASAFAEIVIGKSDLKWLSDLLGPCLFAICMGCTRVFYAKMAEKLNLVKGIFISSIVCIAAYLITVFSPYPVLSLIGCALCGVGAGMMWPCSFSMASEKMPHGGVLLFGLLALAGDFGCLAGPSLAGQVSALFNDNLKVGFAVSIIFPLTLAIICGVMYVNSKKNKSDKEI